MNNRELKKKFFDFEKKYNLFDLKTKDGYFWWDIVRYHVYVDILSQAIRKNNDIPSANSRNILKTVNFVFKDIFYILKNIFRNIDYFFFLYPRSIDKDGFSTDYICHDTLSLLSKNSFLIDGLKTNNMKDKSYSNILLQVIRKIFLRKNRKYDLGIQRIDELFYTEFGVKGEFKKKIANNIAIFEADILYYNLLFSIVGPKIVFMVAAGREKGLMYACQKKEIKTVELQHGQINSFHMYYSYPLDIDFSNLKTVPYAFCSFSTYWHDTNYPVKTKIDIGNSAYSIPLKKDGNNILVVTHGIYMQNLFPLMKELSLSIKDRKIIVKLHPEQRGAVESIKLELKEFNNIEVIFNEKKIMDIFNECSSMVAIQSTTVYEALQVGVKVFLYKKQDYYSHDDLFGSKNLYLVDNVQKIVDNSDHQFVEDKKMIFFKKFDEVKFLNFIDELK